MVLSGNIIPIEQIFVGYVVSELSQQASRC